MNERILPYLLLIICILFGSIAQILFKLALSGTSLTLTVSGVVRLLYNKCIIVGALLYALSFVLWLMALVHFEVSFMYPLLSLAYIITVFLAVIILKEEVHLSRWIGVILIIIGAILVGLNK